MTTTIMFSRRETHALGRNGLMKAKGVSLFASEVDQTVTIEPINSKGLTGRCAIHIPLEDLDPIIAGMSQIQVQAGRNPVAVA